jgi:hypothetical protein
MSSIEYYAKVTEMHKAYQLAAPMPYDCWVVLYWPTIKKQLTS